MDFFTSMSTGMGRVFTLELQFSLISSILEFTQSIISYLTSSIFLSNFCKFLPCIISNNSLIYSTNVESECFCIASKSGKQLFLKISLYFSPPQAIPFNDKPKTDKLTVKNSPFYIVIIPSIVSFIIFSSFVYYPIYPIN